MADQNGENETPKSPRRINSISGAISSLFDKNTLKKNKNKSKSKSTINLSKTGNGSETESIQSKSENKKNIAEANKKRSKSQDKIVVTLSSPSPSPSQERTEAKNEASKVAPPKPKSVKPKEFVFTPPNTPMSEFKEKDQDFDSISMSSRSTAIPHKQKEDMKASMKWVDYLTEDGIQTEDDLDDEESEYEYTQNFDNPDDSGHTSDMPDEPATDKRKIWFDADVGLQPDEDTDKFNMDVSTTPVPPVKYNKALLNSSEGSQGSLQRKIRRDSIAISLKSIRSVRSVKMYSESDGGPTKRRNVDDLIFDMFREESNGEVALVRNFLAALEKTGLRRDDRRLTELFHNLRLVHKEQAAASPGTVGSIETLQLDRETFKTIITDNIILISKAFRQQFVIPEFQNFCSHIERLYMKCKGLKGGQVTDVIPQLAHVNPNYWGVSICTVDGQRYSIGDTRVPFTMQSCSKPLTYAIALNELGADVVHQYVGQEPSGRMFNELVLDHNKKPHNPMVNAGAIVICSLLKSMVYPEMATSEKFDYTHNYFKRLCGGEYVGFNNAVFLSERGVADRNYALGFYMRENKCFPKQTNLEDCMDYYFQTCSMECDCEAMSVMAATLANGGICPVSGEKVLNSDSVRDVLSLMQSCGMYDQSYSGQFAFKVGLPAKSGVTGAIMLVIPNVLGMAVWSPPLDSIGNTVRGVALCQDLVELFNFHKYDSQKHASDKLDPIRHRYESKGLNIIHLLFAAGSGDLTSMRRHHLSGMDMNASDYDGRTALHLAAAEGHLEVVEYLLRNCNVKYQPMDRWEHLPVDDAKQFGHLHVYEFLLNWANDNPDYAKKAFSC